MEEPPNSDATTETYLRLLTLQDRRLAAHVYSLVPRVADEDDILWEERPRPARPRCA